MGAGRALCAGRPVPRTELSALLPEKNYRKDWTPQRPTRRSRSCFASRTTHHFGVFLKGGGGSCGGDPPPPLQETLSC